MPSLLKRLGSAGGSRSGRGLLHRVQLVDEHESFGDRLQQNPRMHRDALIRTEAKRLAMKVHPFGSAPVVAIGSTASFMIIAGSALILVHLFSGEIVTLVAAHQLTQRRGTEPGAARWTHCCLSDDDSLAAACSGPLVLVFDVLCGADAKAPPAVTELAGLELEADAAACALGPHGPGGARFAAACDASGAAYLWDLTGAASGTGGGGAAARRVRLAPPPAAGPLCCCCFLDVSAVVLGGAGGMLLWDTHGAGHFHAMRGAAHGDAAALAAGVPFGAAAGVRRLAYAEAAAPCVLSCERPGSVSLWDARTGARLAELGGHEEAPHAACLGRGGAWALTLCGRSALRVFDVRQGVRLALTALADTSVHTWCTAALSPDDRWILGLGVTRMGAWEVVAIELPSLDWVQHAQVAI